MRNSIYRFSLIIFLFGISISMIGFASALKTTVLENDGQSIQENRGKMPNDSIPCPGPPNEGIFKKTCYFICDVPNTCRYSPSSKLFLCLCPELGENARYTGRCNSPYTTAVPTSPSGHTEACIKQCNYLNEDPNLCAGGDNIPFCVCHTNAPNAPSKR